MQNLRTRPSLVGHVASRRVLFAFTLLAAIGGTLRAAGVTELGTTRIVTDALDRQVEIPEHPQRIVTAGRAVLMTANALYMFPGSRDRVIGIGRIDQGSGNFLAEIDPDYAGKAVLERNVGPEQVAGLNPDLVILKSQMQNDLGAGLERLGIPIVYVDLETPEQYQRDLRLLGEVLGQTDRGEELAGFYARETDRIARRVAEAADRPRTLFLYADLAGGERVFNVPPAGWIQTTLVELAGGDPVWTGDGQGPRWIRVGLEQIASWDPERIALVAYRQDAHAIRASLLQSPTWAPLAAVRNGQVHAFPSDYVSWDQPDVRWILGLRWLAQTLHPERFASSDLVEYIYEFYSFAYGMSRTETDDVIFPMLEGVDAE